MRYEYKFAFLLPGLLLLLVLLVLLCMGSWWFHIMITLLPASARRLVKLMRRTCSCYHPIYTLYDMWVCANKQLNNV